MTFVVRKVDNKRKFDKLQLQKKFIAVGEIQADAVTDLRTSENSLSIYIVPSEEAVERVIVALASTRNKFENIDFATLKYDDFQVLQTEYNFILESVPRKTPDELVNSWHKELIELTDRKIVELAKAIIITGQKERILGEKIKKLIVEGIDNKVLDKTKVSPSLLEKIGY